ncbi:ATP synthase subunit d, mitochondrial-like [Limulus polyphemus]|uniref:ATP synthase subunit d, mitochondrial n=1 Tax=Limulus polyphemus TaxID=6850 RepID=A0ABM1C0D0_LIMPO|nr:ATP synthase subunit d, mitochondrial-like [Limulus polyphemus]
MAARRISKSAIDWMAFSERIPEAQRTIYQAFKSKSDGYVRKVWSYPENPPAIDFSFYRARVATPAIVDEFEKTYKALKVPYPSEKVTPQIDVQEKEAQKEAQEFVKESNNRIEEYNKQLAWFKNLIQFDHMTMEDFRDSFPEIALDPINRPTFWPHDPNEEKEMAELEAQKEHH